MQREVIFSPILDVCDFASGDGEGNQNPWELPATLLAVRGGVAESGQGQDQPPPLPLGQPVEVEGGVDVPGPDFAAVPEGDLGGDSKALKKALKKSIFKEHM